MSVADRIAMRSPYGSFGSIPLLLLEGMGLSAPPRTFRGAPNRLETRPEITRVEVRRRSRCQGFRSGGRNRNPVELLSVVLKNPLAGCEVEILQRIANPTVGAWIKAGRVGEVGLEQHVPDADDVE